MAGRNWCFTINNWSEEDVAEIEKCDFKYCIYGKEIGKEGTHHLQGYIEFTKVYKMGTIKKLLTRAHLEQRKGTKEQARDYCKKENNFTELGEWGQQGKRTDLDKIRTIALEEGMRNVTSIGTMQQINVAKAFLTYNEEPRNWETEVIWLWGKTGTGKSRLAREICNMDDCFTKNENSKWWDGYDAHEYVIIDDFRDSWWSLTEMLSLLDRYEKKVEIKGGTRQFKPKKIIVTSCMSPANCYRNVGEEIQQLMRRVTEVTEVGRVIL